MRRPLSSIERGIWIVDAITGLNGCAVTHLEGCLDESVLRTAVDLHQQRQPLLGVHVELKDVPWFVSDGTTAIPIRVEPRRDSQHWHEVLHEELNLKFQASAAPLMRVRAIVGDNRTDLILTYHHAICDGRGVLHSVGELLDLIAQVQCKQVPTIVPLSEQHPVDTHLMRMLWTYRGLRAAFMALLRAGWTFFFRRPRKLPDDTPAAYEDLRSRTLHRSLTPEHARALASRAKLEDTTMHGALCAALMLSSAAHIRERSTGKGPVTIGSFSPIDLRPLLPGPPIEGLGVYVNAATVTAQVLPDTSFWELARSIQKGLHARRASGEVCAFSAIQSLAAPRRIDPRLAARGVAHPFWGTGAVTNLGVINLPDRFGDLRVDSIHVAGGNAAYGNFISMAVMTYRGRTMMNMTYTEPLLSPQTASALGDDVMKRLAAAVETKALPAAGAENVRLLTG
jgi:NRPS condensation-like uncharacterized protein